MVDGVGVAVMGVSLTVEIGVGVLVAAEKVCQLLSTAFLAGMLISYLCCFHLHMGIRCISKDQTMSACSKDK